MAVSIQEPRTSQAERAGHVAVATPAAQGASSADSGCLIRLQSANSLLGLRVHQELIQHVPKHVKACHRGFAGADHMQLSPAILPGS